MNSLKEVAGYLREGKKAVICGHTMPDGDSIGSVLAMNFLLDKIGVECYITSSDPIPATYGFLPGADRFMLLEDLPGDIDLAVIMDCTDLHRLGSELGGWIEKIPVMVNIDHHISNQFFGTCNYVDATAGATGEIVFGLVKLMGVHLTEEMAVNLYTAIVMDTGSFRFDNTTDRTHEITAQLVRAGVDIAQVNKNLFDNKSIVHLKLLGYAMAQLKTAAEGRVAWVSIPLTIMREMGAQDEHADGIINYPRMLEGVEVGLLFREISPGRFKVGFRSRKRIDVNKLAGIFGGGGHPRASGCLVEGTMEEVEKRVIDLCVHALSD